MRVRRLCGDDGLLRRVWLDQAELERERQRGSLLSSLLFSCLSPRLESEKTCLRRRVWRMPVTLSFLLRLRLQSSLSTQHRLSVNSHDQWRYARCRLCPAVHLPPVLDRVVSSLCLPVSRIAGRGAVHPFQPAGHGRGHPQEIQGAGGGRGVRARSPWPGRYSLRISCRPLPPRFFPFSLF